MIFKTSVLISIVLLIPLRAVAESDASSLLQSADTTISSENDKETKAALINAIAAVLSIPSPWDVSQSRDVANAREEELMERLRRDFLDPERNGDSWHITLRWPETLATPAAEAPAAETMRLAFSFETDGTMKLSCIHASGRWADANRELDVECPLPVASVEAERQHRIDRYRTTGALAKATVGVLNQMSRYRDQCGRLPTETRTMVLPRDVVQQAQDWAGFSVALDADELHVVLKHSLGEIRWVGRRRDTDAGSGDSGLTDEWTCLGQRGSLKELRDHASSLPICPDQPPDDRLGMLKPLNAWTPSEDAPVDRSALACDMGRAPELVELPSEDALFLSLVGRSEVTRGEFARFVDATGYVTTSERADSAGCHSVDAGTGEATQRREWTWRNPGFPQDDSHPVVCVSMVDAEAYIEWLNRFTTIARFNLAAETQFVYVPVLSDESWTSRFVLPGLSEVLVAPETACRSANVGNRSETDHAGDGFPCVDRFRFTAPVCTFPADDKGLCDSFGNVSEWATRIDPTPGDGGVVRAVAAGGNWQSGISAFKHHLRANPTEPDGIYGDLELIAVDGYAMVGFRIGQ